MTDWPIPKTPLQEKMLQETKAEVRRLTEDSPVSMQLYRAMFDDELKDKDVDDDPAQPGN